MSKQDARGSRGFQLTQWHPGQSSTTFLGIQKYWGHNKIKYTISLIQSKVARSTKKQGLHTIHIEEKNQSIKLIYKYQEWQIYCARKFKTLWLYSICSRS